jgi:putative ABC transport system ATP-binding protein
MEVSPRPEILLEKVRFAWRRGGPDVIDIDHFSVERGERLFIAGPSGSGKSTLLNLLGGVVTPREGLLMVLGSNLRKIRGWRRDLFRADHVGFVFQMFNLVPYLSVIDNVTLPCRFSRRRRERAEARSSSVRADATRLMAELELDRSELLSHPVIDLSIGQQQRVAVARALIGSPEIVIADEPTSALDEGTRERFLELLFAECEQQHTTLLFVSHDTRMGGMFDRHLSLLDFNRKTIGETA